jgi:predicted peroxiredoxin
MRTIGLFFLGGIMMASCTHHEIDSQAGQAEEVSDGVFIHITAGYDDAHRALMPLKMATLMADDKDVLVYMDIHAVNMLVEGAEDLTHDGFESARTYIEQLLEKGVGVYACPTCLQVAGFEADDLMDGVETAQKDKFFNFTKGRIITLDY